MNKLFTFLLLLIVFQAKSQGTWTTLNITQTGRYEDIYFVTPSLGWTVDGQTRWIRKTVDGGEHWTAIKNYEKYLRCIEFLNENVGLVGSLNGSLYRTGDGGETWEDVAPNISPQPVGVCGLARADENTIYGVGIWSEPAFVIKSTNQGVDWTYTNMSAYATSLVDCFFFDADHGFVTGSNGDEGGVVLYTSDGGQTWENKFTTHGVSDRIWKIQTPDNQHFYGSIEAFNGGATRMIRSSDQGQHWEMMTVNSGYYYCQTVGFIDSLHGWTGGREQLFETRDGGDTWKKVSLGSTYNRFLRVDNKTAYLTGAKIYKFHRNVVTSVEDNEPYDPVHSISVAPNPTKGDATAHVTFGVATMAHVYIYSTAGKSLRKIFDGPVEKGERKIPLDICDLPAQSLIVVVKTNEGMVSTQVVKE